MFGGFLILTIVIVILMNLSNDHYQAQIHSSYCGDFGFGGKSLTLMKDNTFRFNYYGCSQSNGYISGRWTADENIITFIPAQPNSSLDSDYRMTDNRLLPMNLTDDEGFIYCAEYLDQWKRAAEEK